MITDLKNIYLYNINVATLSNMLVQCVDFVYSLQMAKDGLKGWFIK